jgi:hypothetical protein
MSRTEALLAGASGYLLKDGSGWGRSWGTSRPPAGGPVSPLSARELEVLRLVADGKANHQIAEGGTTYGDLRRLLKRISSST